MNTQIKENMNEFNSKSLDLIVFRVKLNQAISAIISLNFKILKVIKLKENGNQFYTKKKELESKITKILKAKKTNYR